MKSHRTTPHFIRFNAMCDQLLAEPRTRIVFQSICPEDEALWKADVKKEWSVCWKQRKIECLHLLYLLLNPGSPERLNGSRQTIRSGIEEQKAKHPKKRHKQSCNLQGLSQNLPLIRTLQPYRSAIVTVNMTHANAPVERIKHTKNVINRNLVCENEQ